MQNIAIIGGGPGGLMAAEKLAGSGYAVTVYERNPNLGRKFLMAGRGGLNITHTGTISDFLERYGDAAEKLRPALENFPPDALRDWCASLGEETLIGTSGKIFPKSFKASPLLRAWKLRLEKLGVKFAFNHLWKGWDGNGNLIFSTAYGETAIKSDAVIIALGGASWPKLGADGSWVEILKAQGIDVSPLKPSNCGFEVKWSEIFSTRNAGLPVKSVALSFSGKSVKGEMMLTAQGVEGGAIYALSAKLRDAIEAHGAAQLSIDLYPNIEHGKLVEKLSRPRKSLSFSSFMTKAGFAPVALALMRECGGADIAKMEAEDLATLAKNLPINLTATMPIDRAISSAGGIKLHELDENFMLKKKPGIFAIGEMLDWEAQTGGYLLQATFSMGVYVAHGVKKFLTKA